MKALTRCAWIFLVAGATSCSARTSPAKRLGPALAERLPAADQFGKMPEKKRRFREAAVYVDGLARGVLKHSELAPNVRPILEKRGDTEFPVYSLSEYLASVGVDLEKIRALHLYG